MFSQKMKVGNSITKIGLTKIKVTAAALGLILLCTAAAPGVQAQGINFNVFTTVPTVLVSPSPPATVRPGNIVLVPATSGTLLTGQTITIDFGVPIASIPASPTNYIYFAGFGTCQAIIACFAVSSSGSVLTLTTLVNINMTNTDQLVITSYLVQPGVFAGIELNISGNISGEGVKASFSGNVLPPFNAIAFNPSVAQVMRYTSTAPPAVTPARKTQTVSE